MTTNNSYERDKYVNLSNITSIASLVLFIAVLFSILRYHFYYQVLLHIPIFQFVDTSEILLMAPASAITWMVYLGAMELSKFIQKNDDFNLLQKIVFGITLLLFGIFYIVISYRNDPVIREFIKWPWQYSYWYIWIPVLLAFVIAFSGPDPKGPIFFRKNRLILPLVITVWYALFEGWSNYEVVKKSKHTNNLTVKSKTFGLIKTDSITVSAGQTRNYLFFYNRETHKTTAIPRSDIEIIEFNADNE